MKLGLLHQFDGYLGTLVPTIVRALRPDCRLVPAARADLVLCGPFGSRRRVLRHGLETVRGRLSGHPFGVPGLRLYHTGENTRFEPDSYHYGITHDLGVDDDRHFRLPYWMTVIDWTAAGFAAATPPRNSSKVPMSALTEPLGDTPLQRPAAAALITSHLRSPRRELWEATRRVLPASEGFGRPFDRAIRDHNRSAFHKTDVLARFRFNLCPENSLHPGYYTEKVPEAVMAGCIPITWADPHIAVDFDPAALINLYDLAPGGYAEGLGALLADDRLAELCATPLRRTPPRIEPLVEFLRRVIADAVS